MTSVDAEQDLHCRYCGVRWPGDDALSLDDLRRRESIALPVCIKAPPRGRWFVDSGINGHMFEASDRGGRR